MPPPPCTAGATAHVLLVLVAGICALQASASDYVKYDYLPFRAPGGCTELPIDYLKISLEEEIVRAKRDCASFGAGWAWNRTVTITYRRFDNPNRTHYLQYCGVCQPGLEDCVLKWFGTGPRCKGQCPAGWSPVADSADVSAFSIGYPVGPLVLLPSSPTLTLGNNAVRAARCCASCAGARNATAAHTGEALHPAATTPAKRARRWWPQTHMATAKHAV